MVMNVESEDGMPMSIHFNPFEYIRNESDIMSIAGILMKATTPPEDNGSNDQFFEQSAEVLLTSIIYLIHYYYPKRDRNWRTFVNLLDATCVYTNKDGSIDNRDGGILDIEEAECVIDLLSEDEIKIGKSFGYSKPCKGSPTGKRILFIVTSEDKRYYDWIPSMVYSLFFDELYHLTAIDPDLHETLPQHLTFLMDEFANVTLPDSFVEKLSTMRSRNMSAVIIVQNLIQLKRKFPKFDMDKDLIGNCSIIDILGAPDMDSCEYLSKHFGTQTIHKASESDAKDHKGSSSKTEDVMQKSLLSAEDIFAMKKDGECAIVVKGADPLFQTKCRMENTDFVKLLCRKSDPYDPGIRREKKHKSISESGPIIFSGDAAKKEAERLSMAGEDIVHITVDEGEAYFDAINVNVEPKKLTLSLKERKMLDENARKRKERLSMTKKISFEEFKINKDGTYADENTYQKRIICVRTLLNEGYSNAQLRFLKPLITDGYTYEKIKLFNKDSSCDDIKEFISQMGIA